MVLERGVSYYGVYDAREASRDFASMRDSGLNSVLIAISEFDYWFWKDGASEVLKQARDQGLTVYLDLWGWGKVFGGEPGSAFVEKNPDELQRCIDGGRISAACVNSVFREFLVDSLAEICEQMEFDGIFLDEPHFGHMGDKWGCYCEKCRNLFTQKYGNEMDERLTRQLIEFREDSMLGFLSDAVDVVKSAGKQVIVCMLPFEGERRILIGAPDWDKVSALDVDVLATDPYWMTFGEPMEQFVLRHARRVLAACARTGKRAQAWVQLFNVPSGREKEVAGGVKLLKTVTVDKKSIDSIFGWPYLAGRNSVLASDDPDLVWQNFLEALKD